MKALIQIDIEPKIGMVVESLKGRYKHHIIKIVDKFYRDKKYVRTVNENGTGAWIEYNHFVNSFGYVTMSGHVFGDLFKPTGFETERLAKIKELMMKIGETMK